MGLAGRKTKQRIPKDPRNLAWSENAAKFGHTYLAKLGWNPSLGLGVAGDGRTTNIAVAQKLDQLGIGAGRGGKDKDGVAWKQQDDFERMLARLNGPTDDAASPAGVVSALGFVSSCPQDTSLDEFASEDPLRDEESSSNKRKRKRSQIEPGQGPVNETADVPVAPPPRRFAHHRARLLNSKKISTKSASELSEVFGIPASTSTSSYQSSPAPGGTPGTLTPTSDDKITTSTISMTAYFKEKMQKMKSKHKWMADPDKPNEFEPATPDTPLQRDDESELPRHGLGARRANPFALANPPPFAAEPVAPKSSASYSKAPDFTPAREPTVMETGTSQLISPEASRDRPKEKTKKKDKDLATHAGAGRPADRPAAQATDTRSSDDEPTRPEKKRKQKSESTLDGDRDRKEEKRRRKEEKKAKRRADKGET